LGKKTTRYNGFYYCLLVVLLAQLFPVQADIVVAKDGSGDCTTLQKAFDMVPEDNKAPVTITVKKGTYKEKCKLPKGKNFVTLIGENKESTIITYDDYSGKVTDMSTFTTYTVSIEADDFIAKNITFQNTYNGAQAVALMVTSDRVSFFNCNMIGFQDTYYVWGYGRIYNKDCLIEGTTDFIFGRSISVFEKCTIVSKKNSTITAAKTEQNYAFGLVFLDCTLKASGASDVSLGRPWGPYAKTVFIRCDEGGHINGSGWTTWNGVDPFYAEYKCTGSGYQPSKRVSWSHQLSDSEASKYTLANIFSKNSANAANTYGSNWMPSETPTRIITLHKVNNRDNSIRLNKDSHQYSLTGSLLQKNKQHADMVTLLRSQTNAVGTIVHK
jgi:pectinesterase